MKYQNLQNKQVIQSQKLITLSNYKMIESLYEINSALVNLSQQLSNKDASNSTIKHSIHNLIQQVRFLDDNEKYHYYLLISQIYATRFQNIQEAENQLKQFGKTLNSQISMNCELRISFFKYFQQNYKEAFKHLDLALGEVEEQLKLMDNAKFFFNRVLNKQNLILQSKDKFNFESGFILSLIFEYEKEHIQALKQIQGFLDQSNDGFKKFQIYKRFLELYQSMKRNSVSTISISKKSLENYKQDLKILQNKFPQFQQNYSYKCKFVNRVINFIKIEENQNKQKLIKKMLDYKLLVYYKLKKCSKQAPTIQIKRTLQDTAKLIRISKQTELLESILNYDFIKKEYQIFKVFYKPSIMKKMASLKFFNNLCNYKADINLRDTHSFTQIKQKPTIRPKQITFDEQEFIPKNKYALNEPGNLYTFKPHSNIKNLTQTQSVMKATSPVTFSQNLAKSTAPYQIKETQSTLVMTQFEGSKMYKFNSSSSGHQERYFYIKDNVKEKPRLYYCMSKKDKSSSDSHYSLKGLQKIQVGKFTDALRRKQAAKFSQSQCFALIFDDGKDRSFYVPNQDDLQKWIVLLQTKVLYTESNIDKMTHTMGFHEKQSKMHGMNRTSPPMKKSRKINI